jgi:intracellular septation protein
MIALKYLLNALKPLVGDLLSTIVFGVLYAATNDLTLSVVSGMVIGVIQIAWYRYRGQPIYAMQWMSLGLVLVLGSATLLTRNPHFAMFKPSVGFFAVACVMLNPNWQARYMPQIVRDNLSPRALRLWAFGWALMMFALAGANFYVAEYRGKDFWVWYTSFVPLAAQLGLFFLQFVTIRMAIRRKFQAMAAAPAE